MTGTVIYDHTCHPPETLDQAPNLKEGKTIFVCECLARWRCVSFTWVDQEDMPFGPVINVRWQSLEEREIVRELVKEVPVADRKYPLDDNPYVQRRDEIEPWGAPWQELEPDPSKVWKKEDYQQRRVMLRAREAAENTRLRAKRRRA